MKARAYTLAEIIGEEAAAVGKAHAKELVQRAWREELTSPPEITIGGTRLLGDEAQVIVDSVEAAALRDDVLPVLKPALGRVRRILEGGEP